MTNHDNSMALLTDLYELTMAASYFENAMAESATFSLYIRTYPPGRAYFVSAGLEDVLTYVSRFRFSQSDIAYLESTGIFSRQFLQFLQDLRFTGNVRAMPEGEIFFKDEPILEVTAPIVEAQLLESLVINTVNLQSMIATKAARCVHAAQGRDLVDFSFRRTQGIDAGIKVARSSYIAGFVATSNVAAGKRYGIPTAGTMAHSYVSSFGSEMEAFKAFARSFPQQAVLLIDTYDTLEGARKAAMVGQEMARKGQKLRGVRLDSGDMVTLSQRVRDILNEAGLQDSQIFASSSFDEYKIAETVDQGAEIDAYGVGTRMGVSADAPYFDMVYKLVEYGGRPIMKLSPEKANLPGKKQVFRRTDDQGHFVEDIIATAGESLEGTTGLLAPVIENGRLVGEIPSLQEIRQGFRKQFALLDEPYKRLQASEPYPVRVTARLKEIQQQVQRTRAWL